MLQVLNQSTEWFIDGTWDITKNTMFAQAWVIAASYRAALTAIKDKDVTDSVHAHVDNEAAEIKVIKEVLSESNIITCQVHWHRALRKKLTDIGLIPYCNRDITIQVFFR